jgi:hypothetical protein
MEQEIRDLQLLDTLEADYRFYDAELVFGIKGQKALTVGQMVAMEKMYINWNKWTIKLAVWLISKTKYED